MQHRLAPLLFLVLACTDINVAEDDDATRTPICAPDAARCDPKGEVQRCTADGLGFVFAQQCQAAFVCDGGACVPRDPCTTGEARCSQDGEASLRCVDGAWKPVEICWGACVNGACT